MQPSPCHSPQVDRRVSSISLRSYIRAQATSAAVINVVINPIIAWLANRQMEFVPLWGANGILVDTAVTSVVLSLLVALFVTRGVHRKFYAGHVAASDEFFRAERMLSRLPRRAWSLGPLLGVGAAFVLIPLTVLVFHALGFSGLPFAAFASFKAVYTAPLAFVVTRWVILRQWLCIRSDPG